ncbi:MAG: hypothetical protein N4A33_11025 [Bacteriovoracaceae bacterium]|jgi:Mg2+ and Co2+ transporter CorA|nr:hypothetical protein [Bacteriovoracaceae bacterium]
MKDIILLLSLLSFSINSTFAYHPKVNQLTKIVQLTKELERDFPEYSTSTVMKDFHEINKEKILKKLKKEVKKMNNKSVAKQDKYFLKRLKKSMKHMKKLSKAINNKKLLNAIMKKSGMSNEQIKRRLQPYTNLQHIQKAKLDMINKVRSFPSYQDFLINLIHKLEYNEVSIKKNKETKRNRNIASLNHTTNEFIKELTLLTTVFLVITVILYVLLSPITLILILLGVAAKGAIVGTLIAIPSTLLITLIITKPNPSGLGLP